MTGTALAPAAPIPPPIPDELDAVLRRMRFPYLRKAAPGVLATARAQRWDPAEVVRILLEEEIRGRDEAGRRIRRKAAGLPAGKTFASWREADSSIPLPAQHALATLEWVTRAENLCIAGPSGTGKPHFAEALAHKTIDAGMRVAWFTLESLTATIGRAAVDGTTAKAITKITRCDLITVDDIGMLPAGQAAAEALYRLVDAAYERRSLIVTSNLHPSKAHMFAATCARRRRNSIGSRSACRIQPASRMPARVWCSTRSAIWTSSVVFVLRSCRVPCEIYSLADSNLSGLFRYARTGRRSSVAGGRLVVSWLT